VGEVRSGTASPLTYDHRRWFYMASVSVRTPSSTVISDEDLWAPLSLCSIVSRDEELSVGFSAAAVAVAVAGASSPVGLSSVFG